jgi:heat shock protein 5
MKIFHKKRCKDMSKDKSDLSFMRQGRVEIESLFDGIDFSETIIRARLKEISADLFRNIGKTFERPSRLAHL